MSTTYLDVVQKVLVWVLDVLIEGKAKLFQNVSFNHNDFILPCCITYASQLQRFQLEGFPEVIYLKKHIQDLSIVARERERERERTERSIRGINTLYSCINHNTSRRIFGFSSTLLAKRKQPIATVNTSKRFNDFLILSQKGITMQHEFS